MGQLFRYLGVLPKFVLIKAGRGPDQAPLHDRELINSTTLWREYELTCPQLQCTFTEIFADEFLSDKAYESSQIAEVPH